MPSKWRAGLGYAPLVGRAYAPLVGPPYARLLSSAEQQFAEDVVLIYGELDRKDVENAVRGRIEDLKSQV
jgi:hypothetical protein